MAYDPVKAHEYYMRYRKKGLLKGRKKAAPKPTTSKYKKKTSKKKTGKKKGGAKKPKTLSLLGVSTAGLNDAGKIQAALIKEQLKQQMNAALAGAQTEEQRQQIRVAYSQQAQQAMAQMRADAQYAKPKAQKAKKESTKKESTKKESAPKTAKPKSTTPTVPKAEINRLKKQIEKLQDMVETATPEQKEQLKSVITDILKSLKKVKGLTKADKKKYQEYLEDPAGNILPIATSDDKTYINPVKEKGTIFDEQENKSKR